MKKNIISVVVISVVLLFLYLVMNQGHTEADMLAQNTVVQQVGNTDTSSKSSIIDTVIDTFSSKKEIESEPVIQIPREDTPIRGIYVSAGAMNAPKARERILDIVNNTRINALVIDVKDSSGYVFLPIVDDQYKFTESPYNQNAQAFIKQMKDKGVYLIARIVVFQDPLVVKQFPEYALKNKDGSIWRDRKGMAFLDPQNKKVWEHAVNLSLKTAEFGFDEINYDYIRYPSDGKISDIAYHIPEGKTKSDMVEIFFKYLHDEVKVKNGIYMSADVFGDVVRLAGDPGIGQTFEKTLPYFDAVAPMVYPSHFSPGSYGMKNPDTAPKEIMQGIARDTNKRFGIWCDKTYPISTSLDPENITKEEKQKIQDETNQRKIHCSVWKNRPWIQDFSLHSVYGVTEVKAQINALESAGITSWLIWNPSARYTNGALY